jgi:outer membrane autotransporter protein
MFKFNAIRLNIAMVLGLVSNVAFADWANCSVSADGTTNTCTGAYAVYDQYRLDYDKVDITNNGRWNGSGPQGAGIYVSSSLTAKGDVTIKMSGLQGDAIKTQGGGTLNILDGKLYIETSGMSGDGINATVTSSATVNIGDNAEIYTKSTLIGGVGIRANLSNSTTKDNEINIGNNLIVQTKGGGNNVSDSSGYAVYAGNRDNEKDAAVPVGGAKVTLGNNSTIKTLGNQAHAVYANKEGVIQLGSTNITASGSNAHGLYAEDGQISKNGAVVRMLEGGKIYLLSDATISVKQGSYAVYANGAGSTISSYDTDNNQKTSGVFNVDGDMRVNDGGVIALNMTDSSLFKGNTSITGSGGRLDLSLDGSGSRWMMSESSELTTLSLTDRANVYLGDQSVPVRSRDNNRVELTMENLSGNGIFHLRTDIIGTDRGSDNYGDLIRVTGTSSGNHQIAVTDSYNGSAVNDGSEMLKVVETHDGVANFSLTTDTVDIGAYQYYLGRGDGTNGSASTDWWLTTKKQKSNSADSSANILNINYLLNYVDIQTLLQRMGEIRLNDAQRGDFWLRGYVGKLSSFNDGALRGFDMNYNGVQMGVDKYLGYNAYVGIMVGTAKADVNYDIGDTSAKSHHLGLYGTFKTQSGWYVDAIAKYVHINNNFTTATGGGYQVEGHAGTSGYSAGVEVGKRVFLSEQSQGWFVEPQAQMTYSHQGSAVVKAGNGLKTRLDAFDSTVGRLSGVLGYSIVKGDNPVDIYLKTGYVKEFDGKTGYTYNDTIEESYKFNGNWWENGIGVTAQMAAQHNIYLEADYAKGSKFDKQQINLGYRYAF